MISVIICSINPIYLAQLTENIAATIGVPYEIISTDNRDTGKGICQVYNEAALKAQYNILCFVHEDILIQTNNWGSVLAELFKDPLLGLVGVAGSSYRPLTPTQWGGIGGITTYKNIIQSFKQEVRPPFHFYSNPKDEKLSYVTCVDGVWLATTKTVMEKVKFDQHTFSGFHLYDIDFSMSVIQNYKVGVTYEILINHFSDGTYNSAWIDANIIFYDKWNQKLPINLEGLPKKDMIRGEKVAFKSFIDQLMQVKYPMSTALKILVKNGRFFKLSPKLFFKLHFYVLKKYLAGFNSTSQAAK